MSTTAGSANSARYVDFDEYVDLKLQKTRSSIKTTDLLVALAGVAAMFLGYLLAFVVLDQWVVPGGFGIGLRWTLLLTLLVATVAWLVWKVGRPYLRSVNGLFAAREIEKSEPGLKSNLLNLVDLRAAGRAIDPTVLRALERHAAVQLQQIDVTQAIDHRPLMRTAYVLLAVLVMFCLYALFSPKKISNSIWRALLPPANLDVSTRTEIISVQPGDTTVMARSSVEVIVDLVGVIPERAEVLFTTVDGKFQDERVSLNPDDTKTRFRGLLAGESGQGLLQDLTYVVHANDAVSKTYRITVEQPPSATPDKVSFEFPAYMKLESTEQPGGQIDAWEGTKVTLSARTNMPVKSAVVEFLDEANADKPNGEEVPMTVSGDGRQLEAKWTLALRSDASYSKHYRIQCLSKTGTEDPKPTVYGIAIRPDLPPEVALLEPVRDLEAPANAILPLLIQARDLDFELSRINLHVEKAGQSILNETLSDTKQPRTLLEHDLALEPLGLAAGDVIEFWVEAFDNKQPRANRKNTPRLKVTIVKPVSPKEAQQQLADDQKQRDQRLADARQEQNADGRPDQQPQAAGAKDPPRDPNDPNGDPMPRDNGEPSKDETTGKDGTTGRPGQPKDKGKNQGQSANGTDQREPGTPDGKSGDSSKDDPKPGAPKPGSPKPGSPKPGDPKQDGSNKDGTPGVNQKPLSPDGEHDPEVLKTLIDKLGKPGDDKTPREQPNADSKDDPQPKGTSGEKTPKPENSRPDGTSSAPKPDGTNNDPATNDSTTKDNPQPGPKPAETESGKTDPNRPGAPKPKDDSKPNGDPKPNSDPKNGPDNKGPDNKGPRPETTPKNDSQPNEAAGPKNEKGPKGTEAPKNDATGKTQPSSEKGEQPKNASSPEKGATETKPGPDEKPDPASPKKEGADNKRTGEPNPNSPREQVPDSPDAVKKPGTGDEKGRAEPENDPDVKPTPKQGDGLNRDPKTKASTRPADPNNEGSTPSPKEDPKADPKSEKRPGQPPADPKIEQQPTEPGKTPMPQKAQKPNQNSDPKTADEPLKGPGNKDQKSDKPTAGGEQGLTKPDKEGTSGSEQQGEGDPNKRPGDQQKAESKTTKPGFAKEPGPGSNSKEKDEAQGNDGKGAKPTGEPSKDADKPDGAGKSSDKGPQQGGNQDSPSKPGDSPASDKSNDKKQGADKQQGQQPGNQKDGGDKPKAKNQDAKSNDKSGQGPSESGKQEGQQAADGKPSGKPGKSAAGGKPGRKSDGGGGAPSGPMSDAGDPPNNDAAEQATTIEESEAANLEYNKQATELVLKRLKDGLERGDVDPELLEQLGWTEAEMKRFAERLGKHLQESKSLDETPESLARRQQFEEMLKSLDLKKQGTKRSGENSPQRDVNQIESRRANIPPQYKKAYEKFTQDLARQKQPGSATPPK